MAKKTNFKVNGKQYYRVTRTIGKRADGTPIRKQFYGTGINEANKKANEYINNLKVGLISGNQVYTINILLKKWLFNVKKNEVKISSFEDYYRTYNNYIAPFLISDLPLNEIKSLKIQELYSELIKKGYSTSVIRKTHKLLSQFFKYAEKEGYIVKNPCATVTLPKNKQNVKNILTSKKTRFNYFNEEEIKELLELFRKTRYYNIIVFALGTGMREGEILGLQWNDLDFKNKEINVIHNLSYVAEIEEDGTTKYKTILQTPKSENAIRIIPMSELIFNLLNNLKRNSDYVFATEKGTHYDLKWIQKRWRQLLKGTDLENKRFHDLRHTFATMLLLKGANLIQIKELMGHSSVKITEIYLDVLPKTKSDTVNKLNDLLMC